MRLRRTAILLGLAAVPVTVAAHGISDPRVLVVVPRPHEVEVRVNDLEHPGRASIELRRRFDADRNGTLDDAEREDLAGFLAARATANLSVRTAAGTGTPPLTMVSRSLRGDGGGGGVEASTPLSIDVVLRAAITTTGGTTILTVRDWRGDGHPVRAAVLAEEVRLESVRPGTLAREGRLATGISLTRGASLEIRVAAPSGGGAE